MKFDKALVLFPLVSLLAGCFGGQEEPPPVASAPPPPLAPAVAPVTPTKLEVKIAALGDANPSIHGTGAPVVVRIYQLKSLASFNAADFFALYDKDQATLGGDLVNKQEILIRPGEAEKLAIEPEPATAYVAAIAAFRNLDSARWRASAPIPQHQTTVVDIKLTGTTLSLWAANLAPATPVQADGKIPLPAVPAPVEAAPGLSQGPISFPTITPQDGASAPPTTNAPSVTVPSVSVPIGTNGPTVTTPPVTIQAP